MAHEKKFIMLKKENIKIAILAGGLGTRIRKIAGDTPKSMLDVNGKPFLLDRIEFLKSQGFKKIVLLVGYKSEKIKGFFGNGKKFGVEIEYSEEKEPLGTGGAIVNAIDMLGKESFVINGDTFIDIDLDRMIMYHFSNQNDITIAVVPSKETSVQRGNCFYDFSGRIRYFKEKSGMRYDKDCNLGINTGIYLFKSEIFKYFKVEKKSLEDDFIPYFIKEKDFKLYSYVVDSRVTDIGTAAGYAEFVRNNK